MPHTRGCSPLKSPNPPTALPVPILPVRQLRHRLSNSPQGPQLGSGTEPELLLHSSRCVLSTRRVCKTPGRSKWQTKICTHPTPSPLSHLPYVKITFEKYFSSNDSLSIPFSFPSSVTTIHRRPGGLNWLVSFDCQRNPTPFGRLVGLFSA